MSLFHHVQFQKQDPLDDGTNEEIRHEKRESAINLLEDDAQNIVEFWETIHKHLKKDQE